LYSYVSTSKEMRDTSKLVDKDHSNFNLDLWMRNDVYLMYEDYKKNAMEDGTFLKLDAETRRYIT
jgi:hypothetical protein